MIIYNVTVSVDYEIVSDWMQWMKETHIPDVMATGRFIDYKVLKVYGQNGDTAISFAIQYTCLNVSMLNDYMTKEAPALQKLHNDRFGEKAVGFRTVLQILDDF